MILGTAGHIDHGKTTLVRALTGVDTDRLPEEKKRGITIELGFAPLELEGVGTVGVVDVPGHEAFVRTMVAGATGIDLALLAEAGVGVILRRHRPLAVVARRRRLGCSSDAARSGFGPSLGSMDLAVGPAARGVPLATAKRRCSKRNDADRPGGPNLIQHRSTPLCSCPVRP